MIFIFRGIPLIAVCLISTPLVAVASIRTVALTGQHAPGTPEETSFNGLTSLFRPVINRAGKTAFIGTVMGSGTGNPYEIGIWSEKYSALELVIRGGTALPEFNDSFASINAPGVHVNNAGDVTFLAGLVRGDGQLVHDYGVMTNKTGVLNFLAQKSIAPPGAHAGATFGTFYSMAVSSKGTAFHAELADCLVNCSGIWSAFPGSLSLVARAGDQAPGMAEGQIFQHFYGPISSSSTGDLAFTASVKGNTPASPYSSGTWVHTDGSLRLVIYEGQPVEAQEVFINSSGDVAFQNDHGIWVSQGDTFRLAAGITGSTPAIEANSRFRGFAGPLFNSKGYVAFAAPFDAIPDDPTSGYGIWAEDSTGLQLVARAGDHAPGTPNGYDFGFIGFPAFNALGQVAFYAGFTDHPGEGIWATDVSGTLRLIVRPGDILEVEHGVFRTVTNALFQNNSSNDDGRMSGFNDRGQLVFWATFTDGSHGIFVSNAVAVPEPAAWLLAACGLAVSCRRAFSRKMGVPCRWPNPHSPLCLSPSRSPSARC